MTRIDQGTPRPDPLQRQKDHALRVLRERDERNNRGDDSAGTREPRRPAPSSDRDGAAQTPGKGS